MAGVDAVKDLVKPPFANYDIVVYFGCGLFSLPFMLHYAQPFLVTTNHAKAELAKKTVEVNAFVSGEFIPQLIVGLTALFSVYIIGQLIAYLGSEFIEKLMDSFFGKASSIVLRGSTDRRENFKEKVVERIKKGIEHHRSGVSWLSTRVRISYHIPMMLVYGIIYRYEVFGYHRTRVAENVMAAAKLKIENVKYASIKLDASSEWFKALEAIVANNSPAATARMYNYLVIAGLFRSLCFIFLTSSWFELIYLGWSVFAYLSCKVKDPPLGLFMFGYDGWYMRVASFVAVCCLYTFCLFSYFKFQRRYVEDAIFAFVFSDVGKARPESRPIGQNT